MTGTRWTVPLVDEAATLDFAARVAGWLRPGDLVTLTGDLGAGKTTFARALIRTLAADPALDVPSPTFTLMQLYDGPGYPIVHADLYRVGAAAELRELGWDDAAEGALVLVEWADRLDRALAPDRLDVALSIPEGAPGRRAALVTGHGRFAARLGEMRLVEDLLPRAGFGGAARQFLTGDASTRAYERLTAADGRTALFMVSPPRADAAVRGGRPYHHVARLAGDIRPFLAMAGALRAQGASAPDVLAADPAAGLAVIEDLGSEPVVDANGPIPERYAEAVRLLATLHGRDLPSTVPLGSDDTYAIPPYDRDALLVEVELLLEWYAPQIARVAVSATARAAFLRLFGELVDSLAAGPQSWCLRDVHSPNLIWLAERSDWQRIGIIDFQDCVVGHPAYDVASLLQDARVTVPDALEVRLLGAYAILGVQRNTKILGIFARLDKRDGKPHYLAHLPRIEGYLAKGLAHPALAELQDWFATYLPRALVGAGPA